MCRSLPLWCSAAPHRCAAQVRDFLEQPFRDAALDATFFEAALDEDTARLASGYDAACLFVNDTASAAVMERLAAAGVRFLVWPRLRSPSCAHTQLGLLVPQVADHLAAPLVQAMRCAGYDRVDLAAAAAAGIRVARVPTCASTPLG
jgi:D-lactate dehydrogenase